MVIAEQRALPAAEAVECDRYRDRHVDAHHPDLYARGEFPGCIAIAGEDGYAVAILMLVDELHCAIEIRHAHHRQHRAENLLSIDAHLRLHIVEQAAAKEEALLIPGHTAATPIHHQLGAFLLARG